MRNLFNLAILDAVFVIPGKDPGSRITKSWINQKCLIKRLKVVADKYRNRGRCFGLRPNLIAGIYKIAMDPGALPGMTKISHSKIFLTERHAQIGFERGLMYRTMNGLLAVLLVFLTLTTTLNAVTYGSDTTPSRPTRCYFPAADVDNTILGFASLDAGFFLGDYTTKCTYNDRFQVGGDVGLTGGSLFLLQDLMLSNELNFVTAGGMIDAATHSLELPYTNNDFSIPTIGSSGAFSVEQLSSQAMTADIYTLGWSYQGQYLLAGSDVGTTELQLYYFDGATLTATTMTPAGGAPGRYVNSVRWAYDDNYVLAALAAGTGNDVLIYYKRVNGGFTLLSGVDLAAEARVGRWHQSGKFIVVGTDGGVVRTYPFSRATGQLGALTSTITLASAVSYNTMDLAPGGNFVVTGITTGNQLQVLSVTGGGVLAASTSISPGVQVSAVDWSPTGTYIAVGLQTGTQNIRVYAHNVATTSLSEVVSCRVDEAKTVYGAYWDPTGNFLAASMATGTGPEIRMFYFDRTKLRLIEIYRIDGLNTAWAIRWHPSGKFLAYGQTTNFLVNLLGILAPPLLINNLSMILNTDTSLYLPLQVKGTCKINGRGKRLMLQNGSEIVVRPGGSLMIEDTELTGVAGSNVRCLTDEANITLCHCQFDFDQDFTFSRGSLFVQESVALTGTNAFIYTSGGTCTIDTLATLYIDDGMTLQYAPNRPQRDLLYFTDPSSVLYLNNCSLTASRTGPLLTGGTLIFDNGVTLSSGALYPAEGLSLASTMTMDVRSGANVSLYGYVRVD